MDNSIIQYINTINEAPHTIPLSNIIKRNDALDRMGYSRAKVQVYDKRYICAATCFI